MGVPELANGEQPAWSIGLVDLAPFLIEQLANSPFLCRNIFEVVQAVKQQIADVCHICLPLDAQVDDPSTGEDT